MHMISNYRKAGVAMLPAVSPNLGCHKHTVITA